MIFEKEIERISKEFARIVEDFIEFSEEEVDKINMEKMFRFGVPIEEIVKVHRSNVITFDELIYYIFNGTFDGYTADPFSCGNKAGWVFLEGECSS